MSKNINFVVKYKCLNGYLYDIFKKIELMTFQNVNKFYKINIVTQL